MHLPGFVECCQAGARNGFGEWVWDAPRTCAIGTKCHRSCDSEGIVSQDCVVDTTPVDTDCTCSNVDCSPSPPPPKTKSPPPEGGPGGGNKGPGTGSISSGGNDGPGPGDALGAGGNPNSNNTGEGESVGDKGGWVGGRGLGGGNKSSASGNGNGKSGGGGTCGGEDEIPQGDPVLVNSASSYEVLRDFSIPGSLGGLSFTRIFASRGDEWVDDSPLLGVPKPFGSGPSSADAGYASAEWWHGYLALVAIQTTAFGSWSVRDVGGRLLRFMPCSGLPCWAKPVSSNTSVRDRLEQLSSGGFALWHADGSRNVFEGVHVNSGSAAKRYFLTAMYTPSGAQAVSVTYQMPSGLNCAEGDAGTTAGVPYIYEVTSPEAKLRLTYKSLSRADSVNECVIEKVKLVSVGADAGTSTSDLATFDYVVDTQERPGRIATATFINRVEGYSYSSTEFAASLSGVAMVRHTLSSGLVTNAAAARSNISFSTPVALTDGGICGVTPSLTTLTYGNASLGDGGTGSAGYTRDFKTLSGESTKYQPRVYSITDSCSATNACSPGTRTWEWACATTSSPSVAKGYQDKRGNWTAWAWAYVAIDGGSPALEL